MHNEKKHSAPPKPRGQADPTEAGGKERLSAARANASAPARPLHPTPGAPGAPERVSLHYSALKRLLCHRGVQEDIPTFIGL